MRKTIYLVASIVFSIGLLANENKICFSGNFDAMPFAQFANDVENKTNARFYYLDQWVGEITITASGDSLFLRHVLEKHLANTGLYFYIDSNKQVFITKGEKLITQLSGYSGLNEYAGNLAHKKNGNGLTDIEKSYLEGHKNGIIETKIIGDKTNGYQDHTVMVKGKMLEKESGEPLIGATIYIEELQKGSASDLNGFFTLSLKPGNYTAIINCMGMKEINYLLEVYSSGTFEVEMEGTLIPIDEVTIKADRYHNVKGMQMGFDRISIKEIKEIPVVMGEKDVLKVARMLPGVQNVGEGSSGFNVRGSAADQNMFYINKIPVYNTSHLFGFFTTFSPDIVKDFSFYKSNIPAKYGGRLASIFDITARGGSKRRHTVRGGISPITGRIAVEGPIRKERSSFIVSARSTYSDWMLSRLHDVELRNSKASFNDLATSLTFEHNNNNLVKFFAYYSQDKFSFAAKNHYQYSNSGISLSWWHQYSMKHNSETSLVFSNYFYHNTDSSKSNNAYQKRYNIKHYELKTDFTWLPLEKHVLGYGFSIIKYGLDRGSVDPVGTSLRLPSFLGKENGLEGAVYLSDEYNVNKWLSVYAGIRYSMYGYFGPKLVYEYQAGGPKEEEYIADSTDYAAGKLIKPYHGPEWRSSVNFGTGPNSSLKLSYNRTIQYLFMLSNTIAISPTDQWKLCDSHISPPVANQYAFGYYKNIYSPSMDISVELYYKDIKNIIEYKDGADLLSNEKVETDILQGNQEAYGIELMVKKNSGKLTGWLSYCYSRSFAKVDGAYNWQKINNGLVYPSNYDKPNSVNGVFNYKLSRRLSISSNLVYSTGRPVTYPITVYFVNGLEHIFYSYRNKYRIPDYFRMDLSFNVEGNLVAKKLAHSYFMVNIYNLTGRKNTYSVYFQGEQGRIQGYKMSIFGIPIITISWNYKLGNYASE